MSDLVILAPHMDDETLGCGGLLALANDPLVVFAVRTNVPDSDIDEVAQLLGFRYKVLYEKEYDSRLQQVDRSELIRRFEDVLHDERPQQVLIPEPSYHQDHVTVYECGIAATRPLSRRGYTAPFVATYEYPGSAWSRSGRESELNYFVDTTGVHKLKLDAITVYERSQQGRDMVTREVVDAWARLRGEAVGLPFAEGFRVLRQVAPCG